MAAVSLDGGRFYRTTLKRGDPRVQPANNFLAIHRASLARCGPSTSDPATAPSKSTIFPDKMSQGTGPAFFADPKGLERQVAGVPTAA